MRIMSIPNLRYMKVSAFCFFPETFYGESQLRGVHVGSFGELARCDECFLKAPLVAERAQGLREWSE